MNFKTILDSVKEHGGASYSTFYGNLIGKKGYAVSLDGFTCSMPFVELGETELRNYFYEYSDLFSDVNNFLGVWVENGIANLDVSVLVKSKGKALTLAKEQNQKAIFNLETQETIYV